MVGGRTRGRPRSLVRASTQVGAPRPRRYAAVTDTRGRLESTTFTPFARLALAHAIGVCGDVFVTVSLSKTFFFDASTSAARPKVLLYLLVTMAPFALVAPVIGPLLDRSRGGRRILFSVSMLGRAVLCFVLATMVDLDNVLVFPLVFLVLVLAKAQSVAKSALVPAVIGDPTELVRANSRLSIIAIFGGAAVAPFAAALVQVGPEPVLFMASIFFLVGSIAAFGVPRAKKVGLPETPDERALLHAPSILTAGTAMALLRGVVGFFTFFAAFALKKEGEPAWMFGLVLVGSAVGNAVGTVIAPLLRKKFREEWILAGALLAPALPLAWAARNYNRGALVVAAFAVATAAACGRVAFDSLLQRDGAEAARGRAFARFETRFQLVWVGGGVLAVLYPGGGRGGIFFVAIVLLFAGLSYVGKVRRLLVRNPAQPEAPPD